MKKVLSFAIGAFALLMALPISVNAKVVPEDFKSTIEDEILTFSAITEYDYSEQVAYLKTVDLSNYSESEDKVNVYIFRGSSCSHCLESIMYFSSILDDYGKYFNLVTFEVWENPDNSALMEYIGSEMGDTVTGVPYIVIGEESFPGYAESLNADIEKAIVDEYNSTKKHDVLAGVDLENFVVPKPERKPDILMFGVVVLIGVATFVIVKVVDKNKYKAKTKKDKNKDKKKDNKKSA